MSEKLKPINDDIIHGGPQSREFTGIPENANGSQLRTYADPGNRAVNKVAMAHMKARIAALWCQGEAYADIARTVEKEFDLPVATVQPTAVGHHVRQCLAYWREKSLISIDDRLAMVLARYDQLEILATEAYFASMKGDVTRIYDKQVKRIHEKEFEARLLAKVQKARPNKNRKEDDPMMIADRYADTKANQHRMIEIEQRIKEHTKTRETPAGNPKFLSIMIDINDKRAKLWGLHHKSAFDSDSVAAAKLSDEERESRVAALLNQAKMRHSKNLGSLAPASPLGGFQDNTVAVPVMETDDIATKSLYDFQPEGDIEGIEVEEELDWGDDPVPEDPSTDDTDVKEYDEWEI